MIARRFISIRLSRPFYIQPWKYWPRETRCRMVNKGARGGGAAASGRWVGGSTDGSARRSVFRWIGGGCGDPTSAGRRHVSRRGGSRSRRWLPENETRRDDRIDSRSNRDPGWNEKGGIGKIPFLSLIRLYLYYRTNIIRISRDVYRWKIEKKNKGVERKREIHAVLIFKSSKNSIPVFFVERRIDCTCFSFRSSGWFPNIFSLAGRIV